MSWCVKNEIESAKIELFLDFQVWQNYAGYGFTSYENIETDIFLRSIF